MPPTATPRASTAAQRSGPAFSRALAGTRYGTDSRWMGPPPCSKFMDDGVTSSQGASSPRWVGPSSSSTSYSPVSGSASAVSRRAAATRGSGSGPASGSRICRSPVRTMVGVLRSVVGRLREQGGDQGRQARRQAGAGIADRRRLVAHVPRGDIGEAGAAERRPAGQHLVQDDAEGVEVRARVDLAPQRLLGRHVLAGAEHAAGLGQARLLERAGDAEVGHADAPVVADQDVAGLQVAVDAAAGVGGGEAVRDLDRDRQGVGDRRSCPPAAAAPAGRCRRSARTPGTAGRPSRPGRAARRCSGSRCPRAPAPRDRSARPSRESRPRRGAGASPPPGGRTPGRVRATPRTSHRIRGAPRANSAHRRPRQSPGAI